MITKEKEEKKTVVESVQEKANRTVVGTGARLLVFEKICSCLFISNCT